MPSNSAAYELPRVELGIRKTPRETASPGLRHAYGEARPNFALNVWSSRVSKLNHMKNMLRTTFAAALALPVFLSASAWAQDDAKKPEAASRPMPAVKYDPTPLPPNTPSYAPVVEKVAPSVVTISTSKNVRGNAAPKWSGK